MAQAKTMHVPAQGGMRQDISEHTAPIGTIVDALNVRLSTIGEIESRPGTRALLMTSDATVAYPGDPDYLAAVPGGVALGAGGLGYVYDFATDRLHVSGSYSVAEPLGKLATMAREELAPSVALPRPVSQAISANGFVACCYSGDVVNSTLCQIFTSGGTLVASFAGETGLATGALTSFVVAEGNTFVLIEQRGVSNTLRAVVITMSASGVASMGAYTTVATLNSANSYWAACEWPGIGWALALQVGAATIQIRKLTGITITDTTAQANTGEAPISLYADATNLYLGYVDVNFAPGDCVSRAVVYGTNLAITSGGVVEVTRDVGQAGLTLTAPLFGTCAVASSALLAVGRSISTVDIAKQTRVGQLTAAGVLTMTVAGFYLEKTFPLSCPFNNGMIWLRWCSGSVGTLERSILVDAKNVRRGTITLATLNQWKLSLVGDAFGGDPNACGIASFWHMGTPRSYSGGWVAGVPRVVRAELQTFPIVLQIPEWLVFSLDEPKQATRVGAALIIGGQPSIARAPWGTYIADTALISVDQLFGEDLGFPGPPFIFTVAGSTAAGTLTLGGLYQYRAVIERIDANGTRHRSAPSNVFIEQLGGADNTATLVVHFGDTIMRDYTYTVLAGAPIPVPSRRVVHIYRTESNGSTFYRCTPGQGAPVLTSGVTTYIDTIPDSVLRIREVLYTDGGVLGNDCPPSCRFMRTTEDRLWLGGLWDTNEIQSSKIIVPGEPPQFSDSPAFRVVLPDACTGIAVQDGVVIAFTRSAIFAIQGGGPNDQGQGEWGSPRVVTRSTGCISHLSILETSAGIFFQSAEGIELLPRGLGEPQFVGMQVQDLMYSMALGRVADVISASVVTTFRGRTARFVLDDGSDTGNPILIFDLDTLSWSRDAYAPFITAICDTEDGAALAMQTLSAGFGVLLEQMSEDRDNIGNAPAEIASSLDWAELRPFGVAGYGRFGSAIALFDARSLPSSGYRAGNATITLAVDARTELGKTFVMTSLTETAAYQRNVPQVQEGTCGKLSLSTTVGGWRFMGWTVEQDDLGGGRRMAETEQG